MAVGGRARYPPKPACAGTGCYQRVSSQSQPDMANCHISTLLLELVEADAVAVLVMAVASRWPLREYEMPPSSYR